MPGFASGLFATVRPIDPTQPQRLPYSLGIALQGTESLALVRSPATTASTSNPDGRHPSFAVNSRRNRIRRSARTGLRAEWRVTALASDAQQQALAVIEGKKDTLSSIERLEVAFIEPLDIYSLSDRALKYGFVFIGLTFGCSCCSKC